MRLKSLCGVKGTQGSEEASTEWEKIVASYYSPEREFVARRYKELK